MFTRLSICNLLSRSLVLSFCLTTTSIWAARDKSEKLYQEFIRSERDYYNNSRIVERQISGATALIVGLYGYYYDKRGPISSIVYSLTQTSGVYLLSEALYDANHYSLFWSLDRSFRRNDELEYREFKLHYARYEVKRRRGLVKKNAYSSLVLSALYGINAVTEKNQAISNTYTFVSANFLLVALASFRNLYFGDQEKITNVSFKIDADEEGRGSIGLAWRF